jgi:hypothetical protein
MKDTTTVKKSLLCTLTDEERRTCGITLATTLEDITRIEAEKKAQSDHYKNRIAGLQAAADQLTHKVSTGQEWREIECDVVLGQPTPHHKQIVRKDTGEVVGTEPMSSWEMQRELPLVIDGEQTAAEQDADDVVIEVESVSVQVDPETAAILSDADDAPPVVVDDTKSADPAVGPLTAAHQAGRKAFEDGKPVSKPEFGTKRA